VKLISNLIAEEILILNLKLKKGKLPMNSGVYFRRVIPSAILEELRVLGKIKIESEGKSAYIVLLDDTPTNEPVLDGVLNEISSLQQSGGTLNLVGYIRSVSEKKKTTEKWLGLLWDNLEKKGIIEEKKGKHFYKKPEVKEQLHKEVQDIIANKAQPNEHQKSLIAFFRYTRSLRFLSRGGSGRDKEYVKGFTIDRIIPKIFARYIFGAALVKSTKKIIGVAGAVSGQVSGAASKASSQISTAGSDFAAVQGIGRTKKASWSGLRSERALKKGSSKKSGISGSSPGDAILKGVKKIGQRAKGKDKASKICTSCGKEFEVSKSKFCLNCGAYLK
jgi:hypothetical protein